MHPEVSKFFKQNSPLKQFSPGEIIFSQGDDSDCVYYLEHGCVLTYSILPDGREKNVSLSWSGQTIGIGTYFERVPHRAYAIAIHPCTIYTVSSPVMQRCLSTVPSSRDAFIEQLAFDIGQLFEKVADSALPSAEVRIARFICRRLAKGQCNFRGAFAELPFTQEFIADIVGVSRSSVSDALAYFKRNGWILPGYGHITVLAQRDLQRFAYGDE